MSTQATLASLDELVEALIKQLMRVDSVQKQHLITEYHTLNEHQKREWFVFFKYNQVKQKKVIEACLENDPNFLFKLKRNISDFFNQANQAREIAQKKNPDDILKELENL